ncbi:tyrosine-type recombinase/integrase [Tenacibaculum maritimum]|nr:tyrosine-type recombinase/integrase [Tenacibaculum maritimum]CAA0251820.1 Integrase/recombinase XerD family [Tenacibaculum maritimum]
MYIITQYKIHLERLGYSKTSISMLPACTREFLEFTQKKVNQIASKDITAYHEYLQERPNKRRTGGLSESYINHHIYALKLFFGWQEEQGNIIENPISSLVFKKPTSKSREILSTEEIKELYNACETLKEKATLSVFYGCGLRRTEGEKLNLKDIHFRSGILYVREGKGSKRRAVPMSEKVTQDLKSYALKERFAKQNEMAFICNRIGTRTSGNSYNNILKKLLEKAGIEKEITLHCLRHSIATHLLESGLSVEYVRDFLGHKHLESTQIYTRVKNKQLWNLNVI